MSNRLAALSITGTAADNHNHNFIRDKSFEVANNDQDAIHDHQHLNTIKSTEPKSIRAKRQLM